VKDLPVTKELVDLSEAMVPTVLMDAMVLLDATVPKAT
jgi:hypothetical protein